MVPRSARPEGAGGSRSERCALTPEKGAGARGNSERTAGRGRAACCGAVTRACGGVAQVCSERTKFIGIHRRGQPVDAPRGDAQEITPRLKKKKIKRMDLFLLPLPNSARVEGERKPRAPWGYRGVLGFLRKPCELWFLQSFPSPTLPGTRLPSLRRTAVVAPLARRRWPDF